MESPCSRCGCNRPFHDNVEKAMQNNWRVHQEFKKQAAAHAMIVAERELKIMKMEEEQKWLQQKVKKQAAHLRKLEEKIRKLGGEPYAEM